MDMDKSEIAVQVAKEERRLQTLTEKIEDIKADIAATKRALRFWKAELKKAKGGKA